MEHSVSPAFNEKTIDSSRVQGRVLYRDQPRPTTALDRIHLWCVPGGFLTAVGLDSRLKLARAWDLSACRIAIGAVSVIGAAYDLREGGNGLTDQATEKTPSEADRTIPYFSEFVVERMLQLGPQCDSTGMAYPIFHRSMGWKG